MYEKYQQMSDDEVAIIAQKKEGAAVEYLLNKYKNLVRTKAKSFYISGAENEDLIQEGMIGLYKAIRDFNKERNVYFSAFASLCVRRQMITALKSATRQKHIPLNSYISLNRGMFEEDSDRTLMDVIETEDPSHNPENVFIFNEDLETIHSVMNKILSKLESQVLNLYLKGKTYQEIAVMMNREVKSVDNALQRIKRKVGKHMIHDKT